MDVQQIRHFLVLCETKNFRKAAERINIVQPALSRQIQQLEKEVGALLFYRNNRTVTLTKAGMFFELEAKRILQDLEKTIRLTGALHRGDAGTLVVTHSGSAMNTVVPSFLAKVKTALPNMKTIAHEASNKEQIEMLLNRNSDLGVAPNIQLPTNTNSKLLYTENFVLLLPKNHVLAKKRFLHLSALKNETFILPQLSTSYGYVETIFQIFQAYGFKPKIEHESPNFMGVMRLVEAGLGVAVEPKSAVGNLNLNIKIIELKSIPQKVAMTLFWLQDREAELDRFIRMF